nr:MAG TPA: hypothetical protein [Caudoviricetes sp.]
MYQIILKSLVITRLQGEFIKLFFILSHPFFKISTGSNSFLVDICI